MSIKWSIVLGRAKQFRIEVFRLQIVEYLLSLSKSALVWARSLCIDGAIDGLGEELHVQSPAQTPGQASLSTLWF